MAALILPVVDENTTPEDIRQALLGLAHDAKRILTRDRVGNLNPDHARIHRAINDLLDELVGR